MNLIEEFEHKSVLLDETIQALNIIPDAIYLDGTLGGAGHSSEIYKSLNTSGLLIGLDKDADALKVAKYRLEAIEAEGQFALFKSNFANFEQILKSLNIDKISGVILDLGVSSWQLDAADRGFSYMKDGPLDMRMDGNSGKTVADLLSTISEEELGNILFTYGEEKNARRIARAIIKYRENHGYITSTKELSDIIINAQTAKSRREKQHPAKRSFQALRIFINQELQDLELFLTKILEYLAPDARLCIISFHSLEDRLVKKTYRKWENPCICPKNMPCICGKKSLGEASPRNGIEAREEEKLMNPRSKSARLRTFIRNSNTII